MLRRLARESGIETPSAEDLIRFDRTRKDKTLSNADWASPTDPEARIARMKDGTTHLAYKPEHAVDLDTGVIVAARIHPADQGDTQTLAGTLEQAEAMLDLVGRAPTPETPAEMVADKGYHSREGLKAPGGQRLEEPHLREGAEGFRPLARRRRGSPGGLQQPGAAEEHGRPPGFQAAGGEGRAQLRPHPRHRRPAPHLAARRRERREALPDPGRRPQPGAGDPAPLRRRNPAPGGSRALVHSPRVLPDHPCDLGDSPASGDRRRRHHPSVEGCGVRLPDHLILR